MSSTCSIPDSARRMARLAGLAYVIYTLAGLYITFGPIPSLGALSEGGAASQPLEFRFRTGLLAETLLYTFVCVSAAAMFAVLRSVSLGAALVAAFCRLVESAMGATFIVIKYAAFSAALNPALSEGGGGSVVTLLRDVYGSAIYFLLVPMALGGFIFFALFFRSRLIPRWLSGWGMITYLIVGIVASLVILFPALKAQVMLFFLPGALFEWVAAVWLLIVGVSPRADHQLSATRG